MEGVVLATTGIAAPYFFDDYPNIKLHEEVAAAEIDRLTSLGKIFWYPAQKFPSDLCVCPANVVLTQAYQFRNMRAS